MAIAVIGSICYELIFSAPRLPALGQTITGAVFTSRPGGEGVGQAVAAARLGAKTALIGCVGADDWGRQLLAELGRQGVVCDHIGAADGGSGCAAIFTGGVESPRLVAAGANACLVPGVIKQAAPVLSAAKVLLAAQSGVPAASLALALKLAKAAGAVTVLVPAPAQHLPPPALVDYLIPSAAAASKLTGNDVHCWSTAALAARRLRAQGASTVLVTMGSRGAFFNGPLGEVRIAAPRLDPVDSAGAEAAFSAALAVSLLHGVQPDQAADIAAVAGSLAAAKAGYLTSLPTRAELAAAISLPW